MTNKIEKVTYWISREDRITAVAGPWNQFAEDNGGVKVFSEDVIGRQIWEFVTGDVTKMWLNALLQLARVKNDVITKAYRCDSPILKRHMQMDIVPEGSYVLRLDHSLLSVEKRSIPVHIYSELGAEAVKVRCSVCGRIENGSLWEEPDRHCGRGQTYINVVYSVCPDCRSFRTEWE